MPNQREINALNQAWHSARDRVESELRSAGYDPATLQVLPDPGSCRCSLGRAIRHFHQVEADLAAAWGDPTGRT